MIFKDIDIQRKIPYQINSSFSVNDVNAIRHYQDKSKSNIQCIWDYVPLPKEKRNKKLGMDCFMMNGYLRGTLLQKLSEHDEKQVLELINNLDKLVDNSSVPYKSLLLYRGIEHPTSWLNKNINDDIEEYAFSSFTSSKYIAESYANKNKISNDRVYVVTELCRGDKALYLDNLECEWLLPRNSIFQIDDILKNNYNDSNGKMMREIIYYIKKVN